jgi:hypothetical protein
VVVGDRMSIGWIEDIVADGKVQGGYKNKGVVDGSAVTEGVVSEKGGMVTENEVVNGEAISV